MTWESSGAVIQDLGYWQVVIRGVDVTYWRGIPCSISSFASNEPFDDASAEIVFPQLTPLEPAPSWFDGGAPVDINFWFLDGVTKITVFEGLLATYESSLTADGWSISAHCLGALYQMDFYVALPPIFIPSMEDIGLKIAGLLNNHSGSQLSWCAPVITGISSMQSGGGNPILTGAVQDLLSQSTTDDGSNQWTVMKRPGRIPEIRPKDRSTVQWTITCGSPGYEHSLSYDGTISPNVIYGEGIDPSGCHWRNTKYPNLHPDDAPVWPGCYIGAGPECDSDTVALWQQRVFDSGYPDMRTDGVYDSSAREVCIRLQSDTGILVDGIVGPQTWAATFNPGANGGDLTAVYYAPLVEDGKVEPFLYSADGSVLADNPAFDPHEPRYERFENFGANITLQEGISSAFKEILQNVAGLMGTITLRTDPDEGSRYFMRAGQNIMVRGLAGANELMHISQAQINVADESVQLTVDTLAHDLMTLKAIWERNRASTDLGLRQTPTYRNSRQTEDRVVVWDCEAGGGNLPRMGIFGGLWNVIHIPAGQRGTVASMSAYTDDPSLFSVGVFDRPISANELASYGTPLDSGFWDQFSPDTGLIIAWGSADQMAGTYGGGGGTTGVFRDDASWYYESQQPPWLWVAFWCNTTTYIQGTIQPGVGNSTSV